MKLLPPTFFTQDLKTPSQATLALRDVVESLKLHWFWMALGWQDIKEQYRGSVLGPFWITVTTTIFIGGLGPLYAGLFSLNMREYLPRIALGLTIWGFINTTILEACGTFINSSHIIKQSRMPRIALLLRAFWKNLIVFAHTTPIYFGVLLFYRAPSIAEACIALLGFILLCANLAWIGLLLSILCARYRDILPIVGSVMQISFFLTPIIWNQNLQPTDSLLLYLNPFTTLIEIVRAPLIGEILDKRFLVQAIFYLCIGSTVAGALFIRYRRKIVFWV